MALEWFLWGLVYQLKLTASVRLSCDVGAFAYELSALGLCLGMSPPDLVDDCEWFAVSSESNQMTYTVDASGLVTIVAHDHEPEINEVDADYDAAVEAMEASFQATAAREQAFSRWLNKF